MFLTALMFASQASAPQAVPQAPAAAETDVVIVGNRMQDALKKCLARNCPPEEEVEAAMSAGAESFAAGRYRDARDTLRQAIERNGKYGSRMPGRLSALYATYADVAVHAGDKEAFRSATVNSVDVLRNNLGRAHPAALLMSVRIGDMWAKMGDTGKADRAYGNAADYAKQAGSLDMAAMLTFRRALLALAVREYKKSREFLAQVERSHGADPRFAGLLRVLKARISIATGDAGGMDELVAALRGAGGAEPVLVHQQPYPLFNVNPEMLYWADIGFWVRPDGRTGEVEILRSSKGGAWARPLAKQIESRRYAPAKESLDGLGTYRVERFTLRADIGYKVGSHLPVRTGESSLQVVDLTRLATRESAAPATTGVP